MSDPILRVGIVGANPNRAWAHDAHIPALKQMPGKFRLAAVSARTQMLADEAAAAFGVERAFGNSLELARDPDIDIVSVTVKVPEHRAVVLAALDAGKHVYCEWPLGRDLEEAEEMASAVKPGSHAMIGLQGLSSPAVIHAAQLIGSGAMGALKVIRCFSPTAGWGKAAPPHFAYLQDKRNGATLETIAGGHTLALIEFLAGDYAEIDARKTTTQRYVPIVGTDDMIERTCADHMLVQGLHRGGCVSTLEVTGGVPDRPFTLEIVGEKGTITLSSNHPGGYQVGTIAMETSLETRPAPAPRVAGLSNGPVNVSEAYLRLADDIAKSERTVPDFRDAVKLTRLLNAIDDASDTGTRSHIL